MDSEKLTSEELTEEELTEEEPTEEELEEALDVAVDEILRELDEHFANSPHNHKD